MNFLEMLASYMLLCVYIGGFFAAAFDDVIKDKSLSTRVVFCFTWPFIIGIALFHWSEDQ